MKKKIIPANIKHLLLIYLLPGLIIYFFIHYQFHFSEKQLGNNLIKNICPEEYFLKEGALISQSNKQVGIITSQVYSWGKNKILQDSIILYAWIWAESIHIDSDSIITLQANENLRISANMDTFAKCYKGTKGRLIYINKKQSWALSMFLVSTSSKYLSNEKINSISNKPVKTNTYSSAGEFSGGGATRWINF